MVGISALKTSQDLNSKLRTKTAEKLLNRSYQPRVAYIKKAKFTPPSLSQPSLWRKMGTVAGAVGEVLGLSEPSATFLLALFSGKSHYEAS